MAYQLRVDRILEHAPDAAHPDGRLEFHVAEGDGELPKELSNDGVIFPGGLTDFREQLAAWVERLGVRERLFLLYMDSYVADARLPLDTLKTREGRTVALDDVKGDRDVRGAIRA